MQVTFSSLSYLFLRAAHRQGCPSSIWRSLNNSSSIKGLSRQLPEAFYQPQSCCVQGTPLCCRHRHTGCIHLPHKSFLFCFLCAYLSSHRAKETVLGWLFNIATSTCLQDMNESRVPSESESRSMLPSIIPTSLETAVTC